MLKFAIAGKTETANNAHDRGGIGVQALGHRPDAQQHVFARMLENGANDFLALGAEVIDSLGKINRWRLCLTAGGGGSFHAARELRKTTGMSTPRPGI